jgi:hypothetical protein|tara:strand:+ start:3990 stop:4145 length:156 start_codon:yes stop_codon:yes gene_type:complete
MTMERHAVTFFMRLGLTQSFEVCHGITAGVEIAAESVVGFGRDFTLQGSDN